MKKISKETLKEAANNLLFDMSEEEYDALLVEFEAFSRQIEFISQIEGVDEATPMVFPYPVYADELRKDEAGEPMDQEAALKNASEVIDGMVRIPKVVK